MTSSEKSAFRQRKVWKEFRLLKIEEVKKKSLDGKLYCELSGVPLSDSVAQCHHLDEENYTDLKLEKFKILSPTIHEFVEFMSKVLRSKRKGPLHNQWIELLGPFLSNATRSTDKYMDLMRSQR